MTYIRHRDEVAGRIYMRHIRCCRMCSKGVLRFFIQSFGLSQAEASKFFKDGMLIEDFKNKFGNDAMAQQAIAFYESENKNGQ